MVAKTVHRPSCNLQKGSIILNLVFLRLSHLREHRLWTPCSQYFVKNKSILSRPLCVCVCVCVCVCACAHSVAQSCLTLWDPMDCSPPGSSVHGILQAGILEQVATSFSRGSSQPGDQTQVSGVSCIGRQILYHCTIWEAQPFKIAILCRFFKKI